MINWNASPEIVNIGGFSLRYYSLMFIIGFVSMQKYLERLFAKYGQDPQRVSSLITHIMIYMLIGSRLAHCYFYDPQYYLTRPLEVLKIWEGGLASHGGYLGVILAVVIFLRKNKDLSFLWIMDLVAGPSLFVGGLIRIGNLFNSEIIGIPTNVPWAFIFEKVDPIPRHPAMIYESIGYFTIAAILMFMAEKKFLQWKRGLILSYAIIISFTFRFFIEFLKDEQSTLTQNMFINMGQILSIAFVFFGLFLMFKIKKN